MGCPASHNLMVPFVKNEEYQLLNVDGDTGEVSLLTEDGGTKDDLNLPTFNTQSEPTDEDKKLVKELIDNFDKGVNVIVKVLAACGIEKIVACKSPIKMLSACGIEEIVACKVQDV